MLARTLVSVVCVLCCVACDSSKAGDAAADSTTAARKPTAAKSAAPASTATASTETTASSEAATDDAGLDGDSCEEAFAQVKLLIEGFASADGNQAKPSVPDKEKFIEACMALPADAQECLKVADLLKDQKKQAECTAKLDKLPEDVKQRARELMEQSGAK